jgi:hypothetical protein
MRIYELLKMREGLRFLRISVEELREILCCEHSYNRFTDFKRWVIENARDELKEKADIYFNYKVERDGQTPVRINFIIKKNNPDTANGTSSANAGDGEPSRLIRAEDPQRARDVGIESTPNGSGSRPTFNVFAMVLDEMSQDELDKHSEKQIRAAVETARKSVADEHPDMGAANQATQAYRAALRRIRSGS